MGFHGSCRSHLEHILFDVESAVSEGNFLALEVKATGDVAQGTSEAAFKILNLSILSLSFPCTLI